jgi:adenylate cyclase
MKFKITVNKNFLKKLLTSPWTALLTLVLVVGLRVADPSFVESVRLRYFDTLVTSKAPETIGVSVVNIDEKAIEKYGQFPFPRDVYAKIIRDLYSRNAGLIVFNILTPDRDRMGHDSEYIQALKQYPTILPNLGSTINRNVARNPGSVVIGPYGLDAFITYPGIIANQSGIESAAAGVGLVNTLPEVDGVVRRMPMVAAHDKKLYPSLAMEVLRVAGADTTFQVKINENGVEKMRIPKFGPIATDSLSRIWIDWGLVPEKYSLTNLPKDFDGEIVIVGVSAQGLSNPVATSLGEMLPQDLQAAVIGTVIANRDRPAITRPDWADGAEIIFVLATGIVLLFLTRYVYVGLCASVFILGGSLLLSRWAYGNYACLVDATIPVAGLGLVLLHAYGIKFVSEFLQKQAIKKQFAGYCSKEVVELLQKDPDLIKRGVRKDVSVMFSDLRGFTPIGEHYGDDVAGLGKYMNGYMDAISQPMIDNKGMVIKYVGDASMHIHGAPIEDSNHARTIVRVGLEMLDKVDEYTKLMEAQGLPPAAMGWGCNSGIGFIGEMGSTERHSYDILGDMVSTAARLEARCKAYGVLCIIGAETYNRTRDDFFYLMLDNLQPKGKTVADLIYTALRTKGADYSKDREQHDTMHALYRAKKFDEAAAMCKKLIGNFGGQMDKYYKMWIERCEFMKQQALGENWNGEFVAHEK